MRPLLITSILLAAAAFSREAKITILATTDLHGNLYPWDYLSGREMPRGLAKIASLIAAERRTAPSALLLDAGDTIQGASIESVWQTYVSTGKLPLNMKFSATPPPTSDPMAAAMNHLRYDAMTLGNHEFNFGLKNLNKARDDAKFPWLSANTKAHGARAFPPSILKTVNGVRIAIIGLTTPGIPQWEKPENYTGYSFTDPIAAARAQVAELRPKADLVVILAHGGIERPGTNENFLNALVAQVSGIDAVIYGHTHAEVSEKLQNGVLLTQPKNWGMSLARLDFTLESAPDGKSFRVASKSSRTIPVTAATPADPEILRLAEPYHEVTERWLKSVVAQSPSELRAGRSRIEDTAIIDAIHQVQLHYAKADVSFAAAFNFAARIPKGPVTIRDVASLYVYDNELYAIEGNGRMVREALENAARYFRTCPDSTCKGSLTSRDFLGFNYDMAQGVTYQIDLTKPEGSRIQNLQYQGAPLKDDQKLRIALNNYRAGGSGGYEMFTKAPVLWRSYEDIRDLIIRYYADHALPQSADNNWRIEPEAARKNLIDEAASFTNRAPTQ
ncbi:MAG: 5'-nucleotidase C-terminal domain-containing protein [Bryobacteraceae bacterium]|nr:5'-nucleotidase C-terminal domain-containing protein [Bryobacteraceae bacterium]